MQKGYLDKSMNAKTLLRIAEVFLEGKGRIDEAVALAEKLENCTQDEFRRLYVLLPFALTDISIESGISKRALMNYPTRKLPEDKNIRKKVKAALLNELLWRRHFLQHTLDTIKNVSKFGFDEIVSIERVKYDDYVYDFVVPDGHSFIGGEMPTVMHNTQLTHQLSVNVQLPKEKGGLGGKALYIDTEGTFRPERIIQMSKALDLNPEEVLDNIKVGKAYNSDHQMLLAEKAEKLVEEENIKIIIVDSLMGHFRSEYVGRGTLADRQQKLNRHLSVLGKIADQHNIPVIVTNQVMSQPGLLFGDPTAPIGGHILGHKSTFRLYLRKGKGEKRVAKLVDSPHLPEGECIFTIDEDGISD